MASTFKFRTKIISLLGCSILLHPPTALAQTPQETTDLKVIRSTSSMIDQAVETDLVADNLKPFAIIDEPTFLRRSYINIIGRIPTHQESLSFLHNTEKDKRAALIDSLIYSKGHQSQIFNYWADMLRLKTNHEQYGIGWHIWLRDSVQSNKPYNKMVFEMLSASGHASKNPAVGYYLRDRGMLLDNISNTVQVFLGTQIGCAQCHDDPYEDWTQKQYYQLAAFGSNIDYKSQSAINKIKETAIFKASENGIQKPTPLLANNRDKQLKKEQQKLEKNYQQAIRKTSNDIQSLFKDFKKNEISLNNSKKLKLPKDYQYNDGKPGDTVTPKPLFPNISELHQGPNKLENFAHWLTHPDNPQFTKNIANRLWKQVFGYALAEPIDNWTDRTKVSHPKALALVENILRQNNYNTRETLRILYHTQLFQRSVATTEVPPGDTYDFQGPVLRRLSALELHDSLLTLQFGNIDENTNSQLTNRWQTYTHSINALVTSQPQILLQIDEIADKNEEQIYKLQAKSRALVLEKSKVDNLALTEKSKQIDQLRKKIYHEINTLKKQTSKNIAENLPVALSMTQMNSTKNKGYGNKNHKMRASEMPSPFKGGGLLRTFGASDRETPDAAYTDASIPQTLALLNGKEILTVTNNKSNLRDSFSKAKSPQEKLTSLFINIYSRYPSEAEIKKYLPLMNDKNQAQTFAKAMLNSKRFLFLQ